MLDLKSNARKSMGVRLSPPTQGRNTNWEIEIIGIVAGCFVYGAMVIKKLVIIKAFLLLGALGFLTYGILLTLPSIIVVNCIGVCLGTYGLVSAIRATRKA